MEDEHKYYSLHRPIGIGCYPKEGMIRFNNFDYRTEVPSIGRAAWAEIWYGRELTDKEIFNYEFAKEK